VGRGTDFPFEVFGHPDLQGGDFSFTPEPRPGASAHPKLEGMTCYGHDLRGLRVSGSTREGKINLEWLVLAYSSFPDKGKFFNAYFEKLAGTSSLRQQIVDGWTAQQIRESWEPGLQEFRKTRQQYQLYPD
jgi:hypothetical protein